MFETRCAAGCRETFDAANWASVSWAPDQPDDRSAFSDNGAFFRNQDPNFKAPSGYRLSVPMNNGFLTLESYSRTQKDPQTLFSIVSDPQSPENRALQIRSPDHTDGTLLRTTNALGSHYQICARVGFIDFGTGDGANGYDGQEKNGPWTQGDGSAGNENGCYLSAIYRSVPKPHNNVLAHHERLAFIDTDNNTEGWTSIWDAASKRYFKTGWHPIMIGMAAAQTEDSDENGPAFRSYAAGGWNKPGQLFAVDAYKEGIWYAICMKRSGNRFTMRLSGDFRYGGQTSYEAVMEDVRPVMEPEKPQYWLLGDPHINYYEGSVLVDDITLTTAPDN